MKQCGIEIVKEVNVTPEMVSKCSEIMEKNSKKETLDEGGFDDNVFQFERQTTEKAAKGEFTRNRTKTMSNPIKDLTLQDGST